MRAKTFHTKLCHSLKFQAYTMSHFDRRFKYSKMDHCLENYYRVPARHCMTRCQHECWHLEVGLATDSTRVDNQNLESTRVDSSRLARNLCCRTSTLFQAPPSPAAALPVARNARKHRVWFMLNLWPIFGVVIAGNRRHEQLRTKSHGFACTDRITSASASQT